MPNKIFYSPEPNMYIDIDSVEAVEEYVDPLSVDITTRVVLTSGRTLYVDNITPEVFMKGLQNAYNDEH